MPLHRRNKSQYNGSDPGGGPKKNKLITGMAVLFLCLFLVGGAAYLFEARLNREDVQDIDNDSDEDYGDELTLYDEKYKIRNRFDTLLLMGTDHSGNEEAEGDDYLGSLADYILLMIIDHTDNTYAFLIIDRNTMVDVPLLNRDGSYDDVYNEQICTAHWYGSSKEMGCENTVDALSGYLGGLTVDGYFSIGMSEIPLINHEIGGVTVTLKDDFTHADPAMKPGVTLTLTDEQAEIYLRSRMDMEDDSNKKRMERQEVYMTGALKAIRENLKEDPRYFERVSKALDGVSVSNISGKQTSRAANALAKYEYLGHFDIEGETKLGDTFGDGVEHEEFYPSSDSVVEVMTKLYKLEKEEKDRS